MYVCGHRFKIRLVSSIIVFFGKRLKIRVLFYHGIFCIFFVCVFVFRGSFCFFKRDIRF